MSGSKNIPVREQNRKPVLNSYRIIPVREYSDDTLRAIAHIDRRAWRELRRREDAS